ncbi:23S rRNA (cytidine(2498)-2'-O)-methyltransferase RlmM, partial [Providencia sp. wls1922]|nr:23S rRNA (cytidine(2498)-2'-O)-methyltransferase RlmM [Providencia sp. wls1922]
EKMKAQLKENGINVLIQAKQLYHDREEVTVHVQRVWSANPMAREYY